MPNLSLTIYDKPRKWITDSRARGISWDEIGYGRKKIMQDFKNFSQLKLILIFGQKCLYQTGPNWFKVKDMLKKE